MISRVLGRTPEDEENARAAGAAENEYRAALLLPHERSTPHIETPSLVCHRAYRLVDGQDPLSKSTRKEFNHARDKRIDGINALLAAVARHTGEAPARFALYPRAIDLDDPEVQVAAHAAHGVNPQSTVCVKVCNYCCFHVSLNVVLHTEFTTFMFVARPTKLLKEVDRDTCEAHCVEALTAFYEIEAGPAGKEFNHDALYRNFWGPFIDHFERLLHENGRAGLGEFGHKFAEFQGVLLRTGESVQDEERWDVDRQIQLANDQTRRLGGPDTALLNQKEIDSGDKFRRGNALSWLGTHHRGIRRLLGFHLPPNAELKFMPGHAVICEMYDGIALYGSTLHPPERTHPDEMSVRFFLLFSGAARHQLSRVLQNLLQCGELRAAALFDLSYIRQASDSIRFLDLKMTTETAQLRNLSAKARSKLTTKNLVDWSDELTKIGGLGRGGLKQRIARSISHVETLRQRLASLRIGRVSSWQTYDGFLLSNLSRHFDHIRAVGDRFTDLQSRLRQLSASSVAEDLDLQQHQLVDLQKIGEVFAVAAFAYYFGQVITHCLELFASETLYMAAEWHFQRWGPELPEVEAKDVIKADAHHIGAIVGFGAAAAFALTYYFFKWLLRRLLPRRR